MKNNYFLLVLLFFIFSSPIFAQPTQQDTASYPYWIEMMQDPDANFFATESAFEKYWENRPIQKGGGWKPFKRWQAFMESRVKADGSKPAPDEVFNAIDKKKNNQGTAETSNANWTELGPVSLPANGTGQPNGLGRINAIGFHPTDGNTIFVGTPQGGLWKTTDNGNTWSSNTDALPTLGVSAVIVNPDDPQIIYLGSGDRDGGDAPGLGVFKSTDGGATWFQSNTGMGNRTVGGMLFSPLDPNIIFAATNGGIYKSTDGGANWTLKSSNTNFKDIRFKPTSSTIMYASALGSFYRSSDAGESWTLLDGTNGIPDANRMVIGVSEANPNYVYAVATNSATFKALYLSTDSGASFVTQSTTPNIMDYSTNGSGTSGQAWYDLCVAVDPLDVNTLYVGGVNVFKSTDAGVTWTINAHWVGSGGADDIHADQHVMEYSPVNGNLYNGNDGGFYFTSNGGSVWTDKSSGLAIAQIYKIGQSATVRDLVINGYQDNGTAIYNGAWRTEIGGDGMECLIDYSNSNYIYGSLYYGDIRRSTNNGVSFSQIAGDGVNGIDEEGPWITPYVLHETDPNTMFVGMSNIWRSTNVKAGTPSFTKITNLSTGSTTRVVEHSPANNDILYFARTDQYFNRIDNVNATSPTVVNLTTNLPNAARPTDIEAHPTDENIVYITQSNKVYKSVDKGVSWTDISGAAIPDVNTNCIVYAENTSDGLYVGTDAGVYYFENGYTDWEDYTIGFPLNAEVTELEIYYDLVTLSQSVIRASTYGRGLWESPLESLGSGPTVANFSASSIEACLNGIISFTDQSSWSPTTYSWTVTPNTVIYANGTSSSSANPEIQFNANGLYTISLTASNGLGGTTETKTDYIQIIDGIAPPSEDFELGVFPPVNWAIVNSDGSITWDLFTATGSGGTSTTTTRVDNYDYNGVGQEDEFNSVPIDLINITTPSLSFDLSYAPYNATYNDSMRVDVFTDCGTQYAATIYGASYLNLATVPATTASFVPSGTSDWDNKTFDLSAYEGEVIVIKFINHNGYGNNLYIDNIAITGTVGGGMIDYYPDLDGDGFGDVVGTLIQVPNGTSPPADYVTDNTDCDDNNVNVYPGNAEVCDGLDNNCDTMIDENFPDNDEDSVADCIDNCPDVFNELQENTDGDNYGDVCDCDPENPNDENLIIGDDPIASGNYIYNNMITSDGFVHDASVVVFQAGNSVDLEVGFIAEAGSDFTAKIDDCFVAPAFNTQPIEDIVFLEKELSISSEDIAIKIFPNPFKEKTTIIIVVENAQNVDLGIYNSTGNLIVRILNQKHLAEGTYQYEVDGSDWGLGMYQAVLRTEKETKAAKMMIIR